MTGRLLQRSGSHGSLIGWIFALFVLDTTLVFLASSEVAGYVSYLDWMILALAAMFRKVNKRYIFVFLLIMCNEFIGRYTGASVFRSAGLLSHFANTLAFGLAIAVSLGVDWSSSLTKSDVENVFTVMFAVGIFSCLYAVVVQNDVMRRVLGGADAGWWFTSFFGHRNSFGVVCYLSAICALFLFVEKGGIIYLAGLLFFIFSIFITDSRNSFFSVLLLLWLYFLFRNNVSWKHMLLMAVPVLVIAAAVGLRMSDLSGLAAHRSGAGLEKESRFLIWVAGLNMIYEHGAFLSGFGYAANRDFMMSIGHAHFHNIYMEILFSGGIIKLGIYLMAMVIIYRNIRRHSDIHYRNLMKAALLSFIFYCAFEPVIAPFTLHYFSVISTVIFAILPWYREEKKG